jgi:energy-converting hydrogenase A subunit M
VHSFQAPSKDVVAQVCQQAFQLRNSFRYPKDVLQSLTEALSIEQDVSNQVRSRFVNVALVCHLSLQPDVNCCMEVVAFGIFWQAF